MEQQLLKGPGKLLDAQGNLTQAGWATQQVLDCNLENCRFYKTKFMQGMRIKVWDYYAITTPTHFFSFTVSDIGYLGMVFAYVIEFATGKYEEQTLTIPFAAGVKIPRNSTEGESTYIGGGKTLRFNVKGEKRTLFVRWPGFGKTTLNADVEFIVPADQESIVITIPIKGKRFYYNRKINCMTSNGWVEYQGTRYMINPETSLGNLDWGRGVWEYESFWVWSSASGFLEDKRRIGLNLGFGFGDTSAATENCFILDGKVHKLGIINYTYNNQNFKDPWTMTCPNGRLDLVFTPFFERLAKTDLKVLRSEVHQMFGKYNGTVVTDDGKKIVIKDLIGWSEEHNAKW
jgi:hypothetical protein